MYFVGKYRSLIYPVKVASCFYKISGVEEATIIYPDYTFQCEKKLHNFVWLEVHGALYLTHSFYWSKSGKITYNNECIMVTYMLVS